MNTILMVSLNRYTERKIRLLLMAKMAKIQTMERSQITPENLVSSSNSKNAKKKSVIIKSTNQIVTYKKVSVIRGRFLTHLYSNLERDF